MGDSLERARSQQRQFLLSVSHDLRTPLTSIRGYADAIADGTAEDVAGAVAVIDAEAQRLERLVQDLLDLARLDARRFSMHPSPLDVDDVVRSTAEGFRPAAQAASAGPVGRARHAGAGPGARRSRPFGPTPVEPDRERLPLRPAPRGGGVPGRVRDRPVVGGRRRPGHRARRPRPGLRAPLHLGPPRAPPGGDRTGAGHRGRTGGGHGRRRACRVADRPDRGDPLVVWLPDATAGGPPGRPDAPSGVAPERAG